MEIRYVREFLALAETKSYLEASERMFVTPSSLTRHIKALEDEIGVPLIDRPSHRVTLTPYGKTFLPFAREFVLVDDNCTAAFSDAQEEKAESTVKIGCIPLARAYRITDLLAVFQSENRSCRLDVHEAYSSLLVPMLRQEELDFAFLRQQDDPNDEFEKILFAKDSLCAMIPSGHPLAACETIHIRQLREEPLLLIGKNHFTYRICANLCRESGFEPNVRFTSHRAEALVEMTEKGMGVALLMRKPAALQIPPDVRLVNISPPTGFTVYLARNINHKMTRAARSFWKTAEKMKTE